MEFGPFTCNFEHFYFYFIIIFFNVDILFISLGLFDSFGNFFIIFVKNLKSFIRKEDHLNKTEMEALEILTKFFGGFEFGILD